MNFPLIKTILTHGAYELRGQFIPGSNYTFLVDVQYEDKSIPAVYKPSKGEQPLWDFPDNTLALREGAAFELSEVLGLQIVPVTVYREDGPYGPGSLQQFITYDGEYHYFNFTAAEKQTLRPVAFFDLLINNADRKGSHIFFEADTHRLFAIDHGVCFHIEEKLRTVIWDFAGQPIPDELLAPLSSAESWPSLLEPYLSGEEIAALLLRANQLLQTKVFPHPASGRRAFPYPPL